MSDIEESKEILFSISKEYLQNEALQRIGRRLNETEVLIAKECLEEGLFFDIETVFNTSIDEAIKIAGSRN